MSYHYIFDKHLLDYSDGDDGAPYDQNDWSILYLPTFEMDAEVVEGPMYADLDGFEDKAAAIVAKEKELTSEEWEFDDALTASFRGSMSNMDTVYKGDCEWFVLVKSAGSDTNPSDRDVRVYIKPMVEPVFSTWSLCYEGKLNQNQEVEMYSQQNIIDEVMSIISQES